jgi:hypothetical protein
MAGALLASDFRHRVTQNVAQDGPSIGALPTQSSLTHYVAAIVLLQGQSTGVQIAGSEHQPILETQSLGLQQ